MRRAAVLLLGALGCCSVLAASCSAHRSSGSSAPAPVSTTPFTPVRVSVAPAPSTAWTTATTCPTAAAVRAAFGSAVDSRPGNEDVDGTGCGYRLDDRTELDVTVIEGTVDTNRQIWTRPTASIVRDAPELARGAVIVYTPPDAGVLDQCLVAVDRPRGTLTVQVTVRDVRIERQALCTPLGRMLRVLAGP